MISLLFANNFTREAVGGSFMQFYTRIRDVVDSADPVHAEFLRWAASGGTTLLEVRESAKPVWTGTCVKLLAAYKGYLIWFQQSEALVNHQSPRTLSSKLYGSQLGNPQLLEVSLSPPVPIIVEAFSTIKGISVESNYSLDARSLINARTAASRNAMNQGAWPNSLYATSDYPGLSSTDKRAYSLTLFKQRGGQALEVLYFTTRADFEEWRIKLAQNLVFFGDFNNTRYKITPVVQSSLK